MIANIIPVITRIKTSISITTIQITGQTVIINRNSSLEYVTYRCHDGGDQLGRAGTARLASLSASMASKVIQIGRSPLSQAQRAAA